MVAILALAGSCGKNNDSPSGQTHPGDGAATVVDVSRWRIELDDSRLPGAAEWERLQGVGRPPSPIPGNSAEHWRTSVRVSKTSIMVGEPLIVTIARENRLDKTNVFFARSPRELRVVPPGGPAQTWRLYEPLMVYDQGAATSAPIAPGDVHYRQVILLLGRQKNDVTEGWKRLFAKPGRYDISFPELALGPISLDVTAPERDEDRQAATLFDMDASTILHWPSSIFRGRAGEGKLRSLVKVHGGSRYAQYAALAMAKLHCDNLSVARDDYRDWIDFVLRIGDSASSRGAAHYVWLKHLHHRGERERYNQAYGDFQRDMPDSSEFAMATQDLGGLRRVAKANVWPRSVAFAGIGKLDASQQEVFAAYVRAVFGTGDAEPYLAGAYQGIWGDRRKCLRYLRQGTVAKPPETSIGIKVAHVVFADGLDRKHNLTERPVAWPGRICTVHYEKRIEDRDGTTRDYPWMTTLGESEKGWLVLLDETPLTRNQIASKLAHDFMLQFQKSPDATPIPFANLTAVASQLLHVGVGDFSGPMHFRRYDLAMLGEELDEPQLAGVVSSEKLEAHWLVLRFRLEEGKLTCSEWAIGPMAP